MFTSALRPILALPALVMRGTAGLGVVLPGNAKDKPIDAKALLDNEVSVEKCVASDPEVIFADLPRVVRPNGVDDTEEIREMAMKAFPELKYFPDQTANRRKLYMAIYKLRTKSNRPWILDEKLGAPTKSPWSVGPTVLQ